VIQQTEGKVVAEAAIQPARWTALRAPADGSSEVVDVTVEEGDAVAEGDLLVQFNRTDAELALQQAQAALALAEARLTEVQAGARPEQIAVTEARIKAAQASVARAAALRDQLTEGQAQADVAEAQSAQAAALAEFTQADNQHDQTMECFDFTFQGQDYTICPLLGPVEEEARYAMEAARGQLEAAEAQLTATENRTDAQIRERKAGVWAAAAEQDALQAQLELQQAGSPEERIAAAEADVAEAEAALAQAEAALEETALYAPFDGVVAELHVNVGDTAAPGAPVVTIATLDQMRARTKDLTELDVVQVDVGQPAVVTLDALPDQPLAGRVTRVDQQSEDYRGDVVYPVFVALDEPIPALRWGMTALVEIEVE
jgi:multidrug resistance efflux pump